MRSAAWGYACTIEAKVTDLTTFQTLGLSEPILKAITETGYETPTPIQLQAIPPVIKGLDVLGIAQTGTGKTAAFALPILHRLAADRRPTPARGTRCLVLSPTRELASQIAESFRTYGKNLGFTVAVVFGGVSERPQAMQLNRGVDILVATPGRLLDHMSQRNLSLANTEVFVLDEADQMLDLGFFRPIRKVVAQLPAKRQNLFFSATMPKEIEELTRELLRDPVKIAVAPAATTVERVTQRVIHIEQNKKRALLSELLADKAMLRTLVFTRTKRGADRVAKHLASAGTPVSAIHGNKSQNQREAALDAFKDGRIRALVATDIAARGIDIDEVTHVVNFDLPEVPEAYVHRIGRTARAGSLGAALAFCSGEEKHLLRDIERLTRQVIPSEDRRNDANLIGDKPGEGGRDRSDRGGDRREGARSGQRPGHRPEGRDRPRFGGGGGERREGGSRDGARGFSAAPRAPAGERSEGRSESRDRPRSHGSRDHDRSGVTNAGASAGYRGSERSAAPRQSGADRSDAGAREPRRFEPRGEARPGANPGANRDGGGYRGNGGERSGDRPARDAAPRGDRRPGGDRDRSSSNTSSAGGYRGGPDRSTGDRSTGDRSTGDRSTGERSGGERSRDGQHEPRRFSPGGDKRPGGNRDSNGGPRHGGERPAGGFRAGGGKPAGAPTQGGRRDRQRPPHAGSKA